MWLSSNEMAILVFLLSLPGSLDTPLAGIGTVVDPSADKCTGLVEYKNPFTQKDLMIGEACNNKTFCLETV